MRPTLKSFVLPLAGLATLAVGLFAPGCIGREVAEVNPDRTGQGDTPIAVSNNRDLDLLFVIDNSGSMAGEQANLTRNFERFIEALEAIEGGLPNVRIGVVSTDVGTGTSVVTGCSQNNDQDGDNGALKSDGRERGDGTFEGCPQLRGNDFIQDFASDDDPDERIRNFDGTLTDAFSCMAELGTEGCGFEQPLEAAKRALDPNGPQAAQVANFIRPDAFLAVIFITDEDDCSSDSSSLFDPGNNALGPLTSFRCFENGIQCDEDDLRAFGPKTNCEPDNDSNLMNSVDEYVTFFRGLKSNPNNIIVAGIIGNLEPVEVEPKPAAPSAGSPDLAKSCRVDPDPQGAVPGIRIASFLEGFPERNTLQTICSAQLDGALEQIGDLLAAVVGNPCLEGPIQTEPLECTVSDVEFFGTPNAVETIIPVCDNEADPGSSSELPCYQIFEDREACPDSDTGLTVRIYPLNRSVPSDVTTVVRCVTN